MFVYLSKHVLLISSSVRNILVRNISAINHRDGKYVGGENEEGNFTSFFLLWEKSQSNSGSRNRRSGKRTVCEEEMYVAAVADEVRRVV